jgi:chromosome segregation ATPase
MKHMKTCSDLKSLKDDYNDLTKEFTQSKISVKTLKKEAKELSSEHQKIVKKKDDIIEDLMRYKSEKSSEEKDLKVKQKKLKKKLKQVEALESKLKTLKDKSNRKEVTETDDCNNNDDVQSLNRHSLTTNSSMFTTTVSYNFPRDGQQVIPVHGVPLAPTAHEQVGPNQQQRLHRHP